MSLGVFQRVELSLALCGGEFAGFHALPAEDLIDALQPTPFEPERDCNSQELVWIGLNEVIERRGP